LLIHPCWEDSNKTHICSGEIHFWRAPPGGLSAHTKGHHIFHFSAFGEATDGLFGENEVVVEVDLEDSAFTFYQFRFKSEALFECVRQTGGTGLVVSNDAIFDPNRSHCRILQFGQKDRRCPSLRSGQIV